MAGLGVGELALLGAAVGGTGAAATGNDPLKGMLLGALGGAGGAGLGLFGGAAGAGTAGAAEAAALSGMDAAGSAALGSGNNLLTAAGNLGSQGISALPSAAPGSMYSLTTAPGTSFGLGGSGAGFGGMGATQAAAQTATEAALSGIPFPEAGLNVTVPGAAPGASEITGGGLRMAGVTAPSPAAASGVNYSLFSPSTTPGGVNYALGAPTSASAAPGGYSGLTAAQAGTGVKPPVEFLKDPVGWYKGLPTMGKIGLAAAPMGIAMLADRRKLPGQEKYKGPLSRFRYDPDAYVPTFADGGIADLHNQPGSFDWQAASESVQRMADGGISHLGDFSDNSYARGGRLLKGPGDGMSDDIPASIADKQPARLADGEFVVPADVVSHLGNGSTDAGAKHLYDMMDRVRKARTGRKAQGRQIKPQKFVPA